MYECDRRQTDRQTDHAIEKCVPIGRIARLHCNDNTVWKKCCIEKNAKRWRHPDHTMWLHFLNGLLCGGPNGPYNATVCPYVCLSYTGSWLKKEKAKKQQSRQLEFSNRHCNFPGGGEIMGAQNINFALKFPKNGGLTITKLMCQLSAQKIAKARWTVA